MADETRPVFFHLTNIPASQEKPFELYVDSTLIFNSEEPMPADQEVVVEAQLPIPKISEYHTIYVRSVVKEADLDVLSKVNLTMFGEYVRISMGDNGKTVVYKQRNDGDFEGAGTNVITLEDDTKAPELPADYAYKRKNMSEVVSKAVPVQGDSIMSSQSNTSIFFHLGNIPASEGEPFTVTCEGKILILLKESTPLNKIIFKRVEIPEPKIAATHVVTLTIKILALGMDTKQPFDLTTKGHHIMIATLNNGENCIIQQRKDEKFDSLPWQKPAAAAEASPNKGPVNRKASAPEKIYFYVQGADASITKPFKLYVNKKEIYKVITPIAPNQVNMVQYDAVRPSMDGDHIVNVGFFIPKQGFTEINEQEFNITEHGAHILLKIIEEPKNKFNIDMQQQHQPFDGKVSNVKEERLNALNALVANKMNQNDGVQREIVSSNNSQTIVQHQPKAVASPAKPAAAATPAPAAQAKPAASGLGSVLEDIEKLAALRDKGILTDAEFQAKKKQLLGL